MITTLLSDFSRVILSAKDPNYEGTLNDLHQKLSASPDYKFLDNFEFNEQLLDFYIQLKSKLSVNIFTHGTMQNFPEIKKVLEPIFAKIYSVSEIGLGKQDPEAYLKVAQALGKKPQEIIFIDDDLNNVEAAKGAGLTAVHFISTDQVISEVNNSLQ